MVKRASAVCFNLWHGRFALPTSLSNSSPQRELPSYLFPPLLSPLCLKFEPSSCALARAVTLWHQQEQVSWKPGMVVSWCICADPLIKIPLSEDWFLLKHFPLHYISFNMLTLLKSNTWWQNVYCPDIPTHMYTLKKSYVMTKCVSPWYNCTGCLGGKHHFTYLLTSFRSSM